MDTGEQTISGFLSPAEGQSILDERMRDPRFASYTNPKLSAAHLCDVHAPLGHTKERMVAVEKEAAVLNEVMQAIFKTFPDATQLIVDGQGRQTEQLKKEVTPEWSFDVNRVLQVKLPDTLTKAEATRLKAALVSVQATIK
jgi:hypothetical protein